MWHEILQKRGISIVESRSPRMTRVTEVDLDRIKTNFGIHLPPDYRTFGQELGAGTFGGLIHVCTPRNNGFGLTAQIEFGWERIEFELDGLPTAITADIRSWISFGSTGDGYNFYWRAGSHSGQG